MTLRLTIGLLFVAAATAQAQSAPEPPNAPLALTTSGDTVRLTFGDRVIASGSIGPDSARAELRALVDSSNGALTQVLKWTARGRGPMRFVLTIDASGEAFPCEAEPRTDAVPIVRNADGLVRNRLNRAVYDRQGDWLVSIDAPAAATVMPLAAPAGATRFALEASGREIALRFRPRFFQRHRGLTAFRPWLAPVWHESVAGWSSWYAFFDHVTEADVLRTADVMATALAPYGFRYLQIDDGYEREPIGPPANWLHPNEKFPLGLDSLRALIAAYRLLPGIWTNVTFHDGAWARTHPGYFVPAPDSGPAYGNWIGYVMDGSNPATLRDLVIPVYDTLARQGWRYFKVDALRHLRYEGYNSHADAFARRGLDREAVYRSFVQAIRDAIGRGVFMLACWGIRPELAGIVDGVRVGDDGFGYGAFAEYNSFNNVVWRNDPDHIQVAAPDAYAATTLTSLTGSVLMLTDSPQVYRTARVEAARRAAPVPFTLPGQVYDVDASRSSRIGEAGVTVSGSGPRPFDADKRLGASLYQLDIARPFGQWTVLARVGEAAPTVIRFGDLGLAPDSQYVVFEFWRKRLVGERLSGSFMPGPIDRRFGVQDFCIRARLDRPQLVATNRHVTCGGVDLVDVAWHGDTLSGRSDVVPGEVYELYLTEPRGFRFAGAHADPATKTTSRRSNGLRVVRIMSAGASRVAWRVVWRGRAR